MPLIHDIQSELLSKNCDLASTLLKLKFLAAKIGSGPLAEWVKFELEGYPNSVEIPDYRKIGIHYTGTFSGPFGSGIKNAPIPNALIAKFAGDHWVSYELRQGVAAIDELVSKTDGGSLSINSSNLMILLEGKIYPNYACNEIIGHFSVAQLREVQNTVKSKVLELVIELEESIPKANQVEIGGSKMPKEVQGSATQIFNQTVYGNMNNVANSGTIENLSQVFEPGNQSKAISFLESQGIDATDAAEFVELLGKEEPESKEEPLGAKAKSWVAKNIGKAVSGTWKAGVSGASKALTTAALAYYGIGA